jgi:hypothetical protein
MDGLNQDSGQDVGCLIASMDWFRREFGCATWLTHHPKKSDQTDMRGSGAFKNDVDIVWHTIRPDPRAFDVRWRNTKMKNALQPKEPFQFRGHLHLAEGRFDQDGRQITAPVFDWVPAPAERKRLSDFTPEQAVHRGEVIEALQEARRRNAPHLEARNVAEHIVRGKAKPGSEDQERLITNEKKALERGINGTKKRDGTTKPGSAYLRDLMQLDSRGKPVRPFRFILPDEYKIEIEEEAA